MNPVEWLIALAAIQAESKSWVSDEIYFATCDLVQQVYDRTGIDIADEVDWRALS